MNIILKTVKDVKRIATSNYAWRRLLVDTPPFSWITGIYLSVRYFDFVWFNMLNKKAHQMYVQNPPVLNTIQKKAAEDLKNNGIATFHFTDLFSEAELRRFMTLAEKYVKENKDSIESKNINQKTKYYVKLLFGESPSVVMDNELMRFTFNEKILAIVNSYLNMFSRLQNLALWYNVPTPGTILSQNWHRDPEDKEFVKMFLYLRDVDSSGGPFSYVPKTHNRGMYRKTFGRKAFQGLYPNKEEVDRKFSGIMKEYTGKAGTIVLCDTSGLHKGGHCEKNPRLLLHSCYLTDAAISPRKYTLKNKDEFSKLSLAEKYALYIE